MGSTPIYDLRDYEHSDGTFSSTKPQPIMLVMSELMEAMQFFTQIIKDFEDAG